MVFSSPLEPDVTVILFSAASLVRNFRNHTKEIAAKHGYQIKMMLPVDKVLQRRIKAK